MVLKAITFGTIALLNVLQPAPANGLNPKQCKSSIGCLGTPGRNIIKFTPLKILLTYYPSVELGYERLIGPRSGIQVIGSWLLKEQLFSPPGYSRNFNGYRTSAEYRYFYRGDFFRRKYLGFECSYLNSSYRDIKNFRSSTPNDSGVHMLYPDSIRLRTKSLSFSLKWGIQQIIGKFVFDFYIGVGVNFKNIQHFDRIYPNNKDRIYTHRHDLGPHDDQGRYDWLSLPLNMRIGYLF